MQVATLAPKIDVITRRALTLADRLLRDPQMPSAQDPLRFARRDVETPNGEFPDTIDFVIEASLETVRWRVNAKNQNVIAYLDDLFATGTPILQRLAIEGARVAHSLSPDEKLRWLLSKDILCSIWFRTETIKLLKREIVGCTPEVKSEILQAVLRGPETDQRNGLSNEQVDDFIFSLLRCLQEADPSWEEVARPLADLEERYPDFQTLLSYPEPTLSWGPRWVDPSEEFDVDAVLAGLPNKFLDDWLSATDRDFSDKPSLWGYGAILPALAKRSLPWILELGKAMVNLHVTLPEVWSSLAQAIEEAPRTDQDWREILSLLGSAAELDAGRDFAIRTLDDGIHANRDPLPEALLGEADKLANELTPKLVRSDTPVEFSDDWLQDAINHPAGWLWRYWVVRGLKLHNNQAGKHGALPLVIQNLGMLLEQNWPGAEIANILCGQQIHLLDVIDSKFARNVALPFFSWSRSENVALQTWSGFLKGGRWSAALKDFILRDFIEVIQRWRSLPKASKQQLGRHLAVVAVFALQNPREGGFLSQCVKPLPEDVLERFAAMITQILGEMDREKAREIWQRWLLAYFKDRSFGQPKPWTALEVRQIPFWLLYAGALFPEAVAEFKKLPDRHGIRIRRMLTEMDKHAEIFAHPDACAELILALTEPISDRSQIVPERDRLSGIIERIKSAGVSQRLAYELDERMRTIG